MKPTINILIAIIFVINSAFANEENRKEKKALRETIKKEYVVTLAMDYQKWLMNNFSYSNKIDSANKSIESDLLLNARINNTDLDYKLVPENTSYKFKDFNFKIGYNQAVVQFKVDHQMKSAFLEKINGQWKLILAADIDPAQR